MLDRFGNIFVGGYFSLLLCNDPNGHPYDLLAIKYNSSGNRLWKRTYNMGGNRRNHFGGMVIDAAGNCYITGNGQYYESTISILSKLVTIKFSPNGETLMDKILCL